MYKYSLLNRLFRSPAILCVILTCLGGLSVWMAIGHNDSPQLWRKVVAGAGFGFAIGLINIVEQKSSKGANAKRLIDAAIGVSYAIVAALLLGFEGRQLIVAGLGGFVFGLTARDWISHITFV